MEAEERARLDRDADAVRSVLFSAYGDAGGGDGEDTEDDDGGENDWEQLAAPPSRDDVARIREDAVQGRDAGVGAVVELFACPVGEGRAWWMLRLDSSSVGDPPRLSVVDMGMTPAVDGGRVEFSSNADSIRELREAFDGRPVVGVRFTIRSRSTGGPSRAGIVARSGIMSVGDMNMALGLSRDRSTAHVPCEMGAGGADQQAYMLVDVGGGGMVASTRRGTRALRTSFGGEGGRGWMTMRTLRGLRWCPEPGTQQ